MQGGAKPIAYEIKYTDRPRPSRSMHAALETLELDELRVVHPGAKSFPLGERIRAIAFEEMFR